MSDKLVKTRPARGRDGLAGTQERSGVDLFTV